MSATLGDPNYGISENLYLAKAASSVSYEVTITIDGADAWTYSENTTLQMKEFSDPFPHTDHNTMRRTA